MQKTTTLTPLALKDAPALIETVFPAQKVSFEAQKERKANLGQTLTGLGSYWKGRKPLILVRAIVLGSLLPPTDDAEADLAIFEKLMAFDDEGLARRALAANAFSVSKLQEMIPISDPERYFGGRGWRRDVTDDDKLVLYRQALATLSGYEEKASISKRPEELDQDWLFAPVWAEVIKTLRGDYRNADGSTGNRLRRWEKNDFKPRPEDIFQERLYAIHWIAKDSLIKSRQETWFAAPTDADWECERRVETLVAENLSRWQDEGLVPDMAIEPGDKTDELIRTRGWTHWHHLFNARQLLLISRYFQHRTPEDYVFNAKSLDWNSRIANWMNHWEKTNNVFYNQALNTFYNYGIRCFFSHEAGRSFGFANSPLPETRRSIKCRDATKLEDDADIWITDPPYADAVNYHEITEYFIAWLRKNPPKPFDDWVWDSRRALAIKGSDDEFRRGMAAAYKAMADHMPDNGMQCVMFTHQDTAVWGDLIGIFWAAGLQVVAAWYIATETNAAIKKGSFVQGTVILMLKKRAAGERTGFKQRLLPGVRQEVARQIETMMHLNDTVATHHGEPVWGDSDLQMAGYAAALKVLTAYTRIGDEDVTTFALRPRARGEVTVVDEIVQQAAETASSLLVPEGLTADAWGRLTGIERFVLRMMDMETAGAAKLDNYQNFAKAFRVTDYSRVMGDMRPNNARLKRVSEYASRDLTDATEIGVTRLGQLIIALQQLLKDTEAQVIVEQLRAEMADFLEVRSLLVDMLAFIERKAPESEVRSAAEVLGARLKNLRFGD